MTGADLTEQDSTQPPLSTRLSTGVTRFVDRWRPLQTRLGKAVGHSRLGWLAGRASTAVARSRLVQWLTREPDPAVVVIDLTETRTVGPILRVLDAVAQVLSERIQETGVGGRVASATQMAGRNAVPFASGALLGLVIGTLALTWEGADPLWLLALTIAGVAGLLGLPVDRSRVAIADSTVVRWLGTLLAPPGEDGSAERTR